MDKQIFCQIFKLARLFSNLFFLLFLPVVSFCFPLETLIKNRSQYQDVFLTSFSFWSGFWVGFLFLFPFSSFLCLDDREIPFISCCSSHYNNRTSLAIESALGMKAIFLPLLEKEVGILSFRLKVNGKSWIDP